MHHPKIEALVRDDPRFPPEAYEFIFSALAYAQELAGRRSTHEPEDDLDARQFLLGVREYALREFGMLAGTVFRRWGLQQTEDFVDLIENLVRVGLMVESKPLNRAEFRLFTLEDLANDYPIELPPELQEN
jgi:uncharacterized repeat protein (TIGR04138 family)